MSVLTQSKEMLKLAYKALDDKLGEDIQILDIQNISVIADYFIIAHGNNKNHIQTLVQEVENELAKEGYTPKNREGYSSARWVLLDYGNIILHVFNKEERLFYDLERIWSDGKEIDIESINPLPY